VPVVFNCARSLTWVVPCSRTVVNIVVISKAARLILLVFTMAYSVWVWLSVTVTVTVTVTGRLPPAPRK